MISSYRWLSTRCSNSSALATELTYSCTKLSCSLNTKFCRAMPSNILTSLSQQMNPIYNDVVRNTFIRDETGIYFVPVPFITNANHLINLNSCGITLMPEVMFQNLSLHWPLMRCDCCLILVIVKLISDGHLENFLWNCPQDMPQGLTDD